MPNNPPWQVDCRLALGQGELSYQHLQVGNADAATTIVAMHGWLDNSASFMPMFEQLLAANQVPDLDAYLLDFAGHGLSFHRPAGVFYGIWDYALDVAEFIQQQDLHKVTLLGHSMGACVAPLVASILPDRIASICAIEALGPVVTEVHEAGRQLQKAFVRKQQQQQRKARVFASPEDALQARMGAKLSLQESAAKLLVERNLMACEGGYTWRSDRRVSLASPVRYTESQVRAMLTDLAVPVQLVVGDNLQTDANLQARADCVADLAWVKLNGAHHLHMENQIDACNTALLASLATQGEK